MGVVAARMRGIVCPISTGSVPDSGHGLHAPEHVCTLLSHNVASHQCLQLYQSLKRPQCPPSLQNNICINKCFLKSNIGDYKSKITHIKKSKMTHIISRRINIIKFQTKLCEYRKLDVTNTFK